MHTRGRRSSRGIGSDRCRRSSDIDSDRCSISTLAMVDPYGGEVSFEERRAAAVALAETTKVCVLCFISIGF